MITHRFEGARVSNIPADLRYAESHEWARLESDGTVTVGISDHAQKALGDVVFVDLAKVGQVLAAGDSAGVVESVKAASDLYTPVGGEVLAVNEELNDSPELLNEDPYDAWLFKLKPSNRAELDSLLDPAGYKAAIGE
ncbi:glycine cleavage system protein GcvH [Streptomyces populi]